MLKQVVEYIVKSLVDHPALAVVVEKREDKKVIFEINVAELDRGKIIGKAGATIRSIRLLLAAMTQKDDIQIVVDITK